jgi:hypothetical protein
MIDQPINSAAKMTPLQTAFCYTIIVTAMRRIKMIS